MAIVKVIEVIGASDQGFDEAVQNVVNEVSKTVRDIDSVYVKEMKVHVKDGGRLSYGVNCQVSFRVNDGARPSQ